MAGTSGTHRGYELVIRAKFDGKNETWLHLDTITEKNLTSSARIPTQPMQDGNTMADHMYRNPDEYSVSGTFSLYGKYWNDKTYDKIDATIIPNPNVIKIIKKHINDKGVNPHSLKPNYLKLTEAEENRKKQLLDD